MEKLFTITVTGEESEKLEKTLKDLGTKVLDYDNSKVLKVKREEIVYELMVYAIVCTEEIFSIITKALNGIRLY